MNKFELSEDSINGIKEIIVVNGMMYTIADVYEYESESGSGSSSDWFIKLKPDGKIIHKEKLNPLYDPHQYSVVGDHIFYTYYDMNQWMVQRIRFLTILKMIS